MRPGRAQVMAGSRKEAHAMAREIIRATLPRRDMASIQSDAQYVAWVAKMAVAMTLEISDEWVKPRDVK